MPVTITACIRADEPVGKRDNHRVWLVVGLLLPA